jgi:hypothetical protein
VESVSPIDGAVLVVTPEGCGNRVTQGLESDGSVVPVTEPIKEANEVNSVERASASSHAARARLPSRFSADQCRPLRVLWLAGMQSTHKQTGVKGAERFAFAVLETFEFIGAHLVLAESITCSSVHAFCFSNLRTLLSYGFALYARALGHPPLPRP